jgi:diaminohydroxyphosphoribosylaminopyrimidine deaminase/5-amino-6-(5-phosphoribosylamino)uracil reductase
LNPIAPLAPDPDAVRRRLEEKNRPYLTLKAAATLDGRIATRSGESQWITGTEARRHAHRLRAGHDGILVGIGTVLADDPRLTVRLEENEDAGSGAYAPARIVLDSQARIGTEPRIDTGAPIGSGARMLADDGARRIVIAGREAEAARLRRLEAMGVETILCATPRPEWREFLPKLRATGLSTLLVEGGGSVHGSLIANGDADELFLYLAGRLIGEPDAPAWCKGLGVERLEDTPLLSLSPPVLIGDDVLVHGYFDP